MRLRWDQANELVRRHPLIAHIILVLAVAVTFWQVGQARQQTTTETKKTLGTIIAVQVDNCEKDRAFREQYKIRGEAEKKLLQLFLTLAQQNVRALPPDAKARQTSQQFIDDFGPLTDQIQIIPIPDCAVTEKHLRDSIGRDVRVPDLSDP